MSLSPNAKNRHIGLFGGTFNPIHNGHIKAALSVLEQLQLETIRLLPAAHSPFKNKPEIRDAHRLEMLQLAIGAEKGLQVDARELAQPGPSYTINTLKSITAEIPEAHLYLLIGMDAWQNFEQWQDWQEISELCNIIVMTRPNYKAEKLNPFWQAKRVIYHAQIRQDKTGKLLFIAVPQDTASSSDIRKQIAKKQSPDNDLNSQVMQYINQHRLYQ